MSSLRPVARSTAPSTFLRVPPSANTAAHLHSRNPAYRRLLWSHTSHNHNHNRNHTYATGAGDVPYLSQPFSSPALPSLRSPFLPDAIAAIQLRKLHQSSRIYQNQPKQNTQAGGAEGRPKADKTKKTEQTDKTQNAENTEKTATGAESDTKTESGDQAKQQQQQQQGKEGEEDEKSEKSDEGGENKEKKEDLPPPPPHGDKTPWQVFMETMSSEFKASKEWNESTKQLADSAHQFTESESVRRARHAYESTTGAVSSTAGKVLKTSAGAIAKGAAFTWDTPVMKGVRKGATITGDALDKATKPIRETEVYKNVKNVIDDGSSSRYGGWVEKEERRKARELREKQAAKIHGKAEDMVEDPKYVLIAHQTFHHPSPSALCGMQIDKLLTIPFH